MRVADTHPAPANRPLLGIGLALITVFFFALSDVVGKTLVTRYPVPLVMFVRYGVSLCLLMLFVYPHMKSRLWQGQHKRLLVLRGAVLTLASLTMGLALKLMPVGETIAILYLSPFAVMALAVPLLGERVSPMGWFVAMLGFCGAVLILRPGGSLDPLGVIWALLNAGCATVFHLMTRALSGRESAISMLFYVTVVGAICFALFSLPYLSEPLPPMADLGAMALLGLLSTGGHFLFALSYREAPASIIAPVNYFHLVWAAILGVIVFEHWPDHVTLLGMALIFGSGVGVAILSHRQQKRG